MEHKKGSLTPGIVLIAIGTYFLLNRFIVSFSIWEQLYPILILLFAGFLFWDTTRKNKPSTLFWAVFCLCIGVFFLLRNYDILPYLYVDEYWPVFMLALGVAFIVQFIAHPKDWGILIPGTLLLYFGLKNTIDTFQEFYWGWDIYIDDFWPLIIVIIGIGIVISGLKASKKITKNESKQ